MLLAVIYKARDKVWQNLLNFTDVTHSPISSSNKLEKNGFLTIDRKANTYSNKTNVLD